MALLGAHMSIAGGYWKAIDAADTFGMEACQIFTKNNNQWRARALTDDDIASFQSRLGSSGVRALLAHASYLINLASPDDVLHRRSIEAMIVEVERADRLGLQHLVVHPGACMGSDEAAGLARVVAALDEVHTHHPRACVRILLETTAGQGSSLGHRFEHLAAIIESVRHPDRLGVCLDTCHVFAAGYSLAPAPAYRTTMKQFDSIVGLSRLEAFHLNDSRKPLGSRVDRHAHIGRGHLGLEPFRLLLNDHRFRRHPMIFETPKGIENGRELDEVNLTTLRELYAKARVE